MALTKVTGKGLDNNVVDSTKLSTNSVTETKIASGAVTSAKILDGKQLPKQAFNYILRPSKWQ